MLKLSLIIPVYNEERHIKACLDAIAEQTVMPDEVIVVDNNCSDRTIDIANRYDFVQVVKESQQGRSYARNKGFNTASGDIIGRIDADSQLKPNWVELVKKHFEDESVASITGIALTPIFPKLQHPRSTILSRTYYWYVHALFGTITTWGANMAVRKTAWSEVKDLVSTDDRIVHEDQDISLWLAGKGYIIKQTNDVIVVSTNQSFRYLPKLLHYQRMRISTKRFHRKAGNLPAPKNVQLLLYDRIISLLFSLPFLLYGLIVMIVFFPIDFIAVKLLHNQQWFD